MSDTVLVLARHSNGEVSESTHELLGKAKELAEAWGGQAEVALLGAPGLADQLGAADVVVTVDHPLLAEYLPAAYEAALAHVLAERSPRLLLLANDTAGLDLAPALSVTWPAPLAAYVVGLAVEDGAAVATAQVLGGKMSAEIALDADRSICTVIAGAFPADTGRAAGTPEVVSLDPPSGLDDLGMTLEQVNEPEGGDVDITAAELLVSVGRGIGSQDNLELVQELADAIGAPLSGSRPVIDAGWLPKSRQVGKSGLKVKPKAYLAFGISGAPEHLEGMRDGELIIACNTDPQAPIFDVAHYGSTVDLFDLAPALVDRIKG